MKFSLSSPATLPGTPAQAAPSGVAISTLTHADLAAASRLHGAVFGPGRFARTAYRIRESATAITPACCKLVIGGWLQGAVQMTRIRVGAEARGMLLGPLVVAEAHANKGYGQALIAAANEKAAALGAEFVILVGDLPYYEKSGFARVPGGKITLPGPVDPRRLLIRMFAEDASMPQGVLRAITA